MSSEKEEIRKEGKKEKREGGKETSIFPVSALCFHTHYLVYLSNCTLVRRYLTLHFCRDESLRKC